MRSPEVNSPNVPSPMNRGKVTSDGPSNVPQAVNDEYMGDSVGTPAPPIAENTRDPSQFGTFLASGGYGTGSINAQQSERANVLRGTQLQDLLKGSRNVETVYAVILIFASTTQHLQRE